MFITVTGGSGSGKSGRAEEIAMKLASSCKENTDGHFTQEKSRLIYLASMDPSGPEAEARIRRHRLLREGKGFITIEKKNCLTELDPAQLSGGTVLLEDLSNLVSNEMFASGGSSIPEEETASLVLKDTDFLLQAAENLIVVMNEIFSDGLAYSSETESFLRVLGRLNGELAKRADRSYEVVYGIPVRLK